MSRKRFDQMECGVAQALDRIGDWWTLLIVRECLTGTTRFRDFERNLGIAKNILAARLEGLVENEILEKRLQPDSERRYEYHLTRKGRDLWVVLTALRLWSDKWVFGPGNEPALVGDPESGRIVRGLLAVDAEGEPLDLSSLEWLRWPGKEPDPNGASEKSSGK